MKKIIGCPAGEWALKLYTVDRFISLEYLLDEQEGEYGICGFPQRVHSYEYLRNEKIDDLIVIINDTRKYEEIKKKLEKYGLIENIHFFNGWKLDSNFYHEVYADKGWQEFEQSDTNALKRQRQGWKDRARAMSQLIPEDVKVEKYGLIENIHFFNGWKLDSNFYHEVYADKGWQEFEQSDTNALKRQRQGWKDRARAMSQLIPEDVKVLMDIGCGEELLKEFLCKDIKYYGLDYCERNKETIICDINKEKLPDIKVDLYYMAGIIDYVIDIPNFIKQLSRAKYVVMSKTRNERFIRLDDKVMDSGYMNYGISSYYCSNLITDMFEIGFVCRKMQWNYKQRDEYYFLFENYAVKQNN